MSFIIRRSILATSLPRASVASRTLSTQTRLCKSATDSAKETLETANKKAGEIGVAGIESAQDVIEKAKSVAGMNANKAEGKTSEMAGEIKGKTSEVMGEAKGKANEVKGKAEGAMS